MKFPLGHGDLVVMGGSCQRTWEHCIPKTTKPVGPRAAIADLRAFMRHGSREQFIGAALAILVTMIIIIEFLVDSKINTAPPPRVVEVQLYSSDRTDAEIIAQQKVDQAKRDAAAKQKQRQFQKLEKKFGM